MSLPWVKLATTFPSNPKVLGMVEDKQHRALVVYLCSLAYSGGQGSDGFIPFGALAFVHGTKKDADQLVDAGFWKPAPGGWEINDWHEHQLSNDETRARKQRQIRGAVKTNCRRWHGPDCGCWAREP